MIHISPFFFYPPLNPIVSRLRVLFIKLVLIPALSRGNAKLSGIFSDQIGVCVTKCCLAVFPFMLNCYHTHYTVASPQSLIVKLTTTPLEQISAVLGPALALVDTPS